MNQEEEKWNLEIKMIAYRKQIEGINQNEAEINQKILEIAQEKSQKLKTIQENFIENFYNSLYYTIPLSCVNMIITKSLLIIPFTIAVGGIINIKHEK